MKSEKETTLLIYELFKSYSFYTLDIGARFGLHPLFKKYIDFLEVDAFDPDEDECLKQQQLSKGDVAFVPLALAKETKTYPFYLLKTKSGSSIYKPNTKSNRPTPFSIPDDYSKIEEILELECVNFHEYRINNEKPKPVFVKLDTQGSELDILQGLAEEDWDDLVFVETEVEFLDFYEDQPLFHDVHKFLSDKGFSLLKITRHPTFYYRGENKYSYLERNLRLFKNQFDDINSPYVSADTVYFKLPFHNNSPKSKRNLMSFILGALMWQNLDLVCWVIEEQAAKDMLTLEEREKINRLVFLLSPRYTGLVLILKRITHLCRFILSAPIESSIKLLYGKLRGLIPETQAPSNK